MTKESLSTQDVEETISTEETSQVQDSHEDIVEPQYSETELAAMDQGWKPKDQLEEGKEFISADEFIRRGELFSKIDVLGKELKDTKKALKMLTEHHSQVRDTEFNRALTYLKQQKKDALIEGDADKVVELDDQIAEVKAKRQVEQQQQRQESAQPDPRFLQWVDKNAWYVQDNELRAFADEVGVSHSKLNPGKDPEDVLKYVAERVRKAFPEKFTNPNRARTSPVEGRTQSKPASKSDDFELTDDEKRVMHTFVRQGVMTAEEYKAELKRVKG